MQTTQVWILSFLTGIEPASLQNGGSVRDHRSQWILVNGYLGA